MTKQEEVTPSGEQRVERQLRHITLLLDRNAQLAKALRAYVKFSDEAAKLLDADKDHKCLKLLLAMSGHAPRYRHDVDEARAALALVDGPQETK